MPKAPFPVSTILRNFHNEFNNKIASLDIAEKWDNVGFLIESPRSSSYSRLKILSCIDLTSDVVTEAISLNCNMIFSYHPILFKPVQSLTMTAQSTVLRCIDAGINVFSPHTALDNVDNGMNDFLCDYFQSYESMREGVKIDPVSGIKSGRITRFVSPLSLVQIISIIKERLGLSLVRYASPQGRTDLFIDSMAVCVGSGSSVLSGANASLFLTGEMSHHEILACLASGKSVIMLDHSSSERPYLPELSKRLREFDCVESVLVSKCDREPICSV
jgi:dinuclear metal center YbgI/SA1388 family protein